MIAAAVQRRAFLNMIATSEGTRTSPITKNDGYDVIVTGIDGRPEIFTDYSDHPFAKGRPSKVINSRGLTSNAAGRYQQMLRDWPHYKAMLNLHDFGPVAQDLLAIQHLREGGALPLIDAGQFAAAVARVRNIWASLPGAGFGQRENPLSTLQVAFVKSGGIVTA